jgi:hypothetical protein
MTRRIELVPVPAAGDRTTYRILADGKRVGTAFELADDPAAPWRLNLFGHCAGLRRSSRSVLVQTVERLLGTGRAAPVVYVPAAPGSQWDAVAAELRAAGFDVRPAVLLSPIVICPGEA